MSENLIYTNTDGSFPDLATIPATVAGHYAKVGVNVNTHRLMVDAVIVEGGGGGGTPVVTTGTHGTKTVTSSGTPVALTATSTKVLTVIIVPLKANTNVIYGGFSNVSGAQHVVVPWTISAPSGEVLDLSLIYIDAAVSGEGACWEAIS